MQTKLNSLAAPIQIGPANILNRTDSPATLLFLSQAVAAGNGNLRGLSLIRLGQPDATLGGQPDGKSYLLEALLGFCFNTREVKMGSYKPLILQMVFNMEKKKQKNERQK